MCVRGGAGLLECAAMSPFRQWPLPSLEPFGSVWWWRTSRRLALRCETRSEVKAGARYRDLLRYVVRGLPRTLWLKCKLQASVPPPARLFSGLAAMSVAALHRAVAALVSAGALRRTIATNVAVVASALFKAAPRSPAAADADAARGSARLFWRPSLLDPKGASKDRGDMQQAHMSKKP